MRQTLNELIWFRLSEILTTTVLFITIGTLSICAQSATIGDWVWNDANRNGIQDQSESGISGVELLLYNGNRQLVEKTTSDAQGHYSFTDLSGGNYYIEVGDHGAYLPTVPFYSDIDRNSDIDLLFLRTGFFKISDNDTITHIDIGFYMLQETSEYSSIGDWVWNDQNGNGLQDPGESGIGGITLKLYNAQRDEVARTVSNTDGSYLFDSLEAGRYYIQIVLDDIYFPTKNIIGSTDLNSDIDPLFLKTGLIILDSGEELTNYDVGLYKTSNISGYIWGDDKDCLVELDEEFLISVRVFLLNTNKNIVAEAITDFDGSFEFSNIIPGAYFISVEASSLYDMCVFGNEIYTLEEYKDQLIISGIDLISGGNIQNIFIGLSPVQKCLWSIEVVEMAQPKCGDSSGFILIDIIGSIGDYEINWSHGGTEHLTTELSAGNYTLTVEDLNGCSQSLDISISDIGLCEPVKERVALDLRVFLEGIHDLDNGNLNATLRDNGYLPGMTPKTIFGKKTEGGQPFNRAPWSYEGFEGVFIDNYEAYYPEETMDWVLVSVRQNITKESEVLKRAGLLMSDGSIIFPDDSPPVVLDITRSYYIVVEHRNHLIIMTETPQAIYDNKLNYDFTRSQSYRGLLGHGQKMMLDGSYAMFAGNLDFEAYGNSDLNYGDIVQFIKENGKHSSYYTADMDMNADVNVKDKKLILDNVGVFSDVPQ